VDRPSVSTTDPDDDRLLFGDVELIEDEVACPLQY
jgi:hypothetical protein